MACTWAKRGACRVVVRRPEGKRLLVRSRRRRDENIRTNLKYVGWKSVGWIDLAPDWANLWAVMIMVINIRISRNFFNSQRTLIHGVGGLVG